MVTVHHSMSDVIEAQPFGFAVVEVHMSKQICLLDQCPKNLNLAKVNQTHVEASDSVLNRTKQRIKSIPNWFSLNYN